MKHWIKKQHNNSNITAEIKLSKDDAIVSVTEPIEIFNAMNEYFVNVSNSVAESINLDGSEPVFTYFMKEYQIQCL